MDSQWLKAQFKLHPQRSKAELAKALGVEPPAVSKILSGKRQIKAQEYLLMRRFFGLSVENDRADSGNKKSYILQTLSEDNFFREGTTNEEEWMLPASILNQRTKASPDKIKIFQIKENTMQPEYNYGEHVLVDLSDKKPSPPGIFLVSDGFGFMVRNCAYIPNSDPPKIKLSASQKGFQSQSLREGEFTMIGRVIAKLHWV